MLHKSASETFLGACLAPEGMALALEQIAHMAGAEAANLIFSHGTQQLGTVYSESLREHVAAYVRADTPPDPRVSRVNPSMREGFRFDHDDFTTEEIAHDPYYQEFLRPRGYGWHACALLADAPSGETINLSLKRTLRQGAFDPGDLAALSAQLPLIRATASISQLMGRALEADRRPLGDQYRAVFGFDEKGSAFALRELEETAGVLTVRRGRLVACDPVNRPKVEAALECAHANAKTVAVLLTDNTGGRWVLHVVPATLMARPWMTSLASLVVLKSIDRTRLPLQEERSLIAGLFGLSATEARVALLVGQGKSIGEIAALLASSSGTVRNHLKAAFAKTGVARQVELAALLSRL
jgi:DNA-binding CsgD family transcriptional regulator